MKPVGKTYLIEAEPPKEEVLAGGIVVPVTGSNRDYESYKGHILEYGIGFTEQEKKDLIPIGTRVMMDYTKNAKKTKLFMDEKIYYIYKPEDILAIIGEEEGNGN